MSEHGGNEKTVRHVLFHDVNCNDDLPEITREENTFHWIRESIQFGCKYGAIVFVLILVATYFVYPTASAFFALTNDVSFKIYKHVTITCTLLTIVVFSIAFASEKMLEYETYARVLDVPKSWKLMTSAIVGCLIVSYLWTSIVVGIYWFFLMNPLKTLTYAKPNLAKKVVSKTISRIESGILVPKEYVASSSLIKKMIMKKSSFRTLEKCMKTDKVSKKKIVKGIVIADDLLTSTVIFFCPTTKATRGNFSQWEKQLFVLDIHDFDTRNYFKNEHEILYKLLQVKDKVDRFLKAHYTGD
jgi:hypothetical protein